MQNLSFRFKTHLKLSQPVWEHAFLLRCEPLEAPRQQVLSCTLNVGPGDIPLSEGKDSFGNRTLSGYLAQSHDEFFYEVSGKIRRDDAQGEKDPYPLPAYRYPSRLTAPTYALQQYARKLNLTGTPWEKAEALQNAVYQKITYQSGSTNINTTAGVAFRQGCGVCQDFSHIFLAVARICGLTARYVCGLPEGIGATHAWVEVWQDGYWKAFDPTRGHLADETYIALGTGRDYWDCAIERGLFTGTTRQQQSVYVEVKKED